VGDYRHLLPCGFKFFMERGKNVVIIEQLDSIREQFAIFELLLRQAATTTWEADSRNE
jgi:hypothetical protein